MTNRARHIVVILLLLLPVLYAGSYLALVVPEGDLVTVPVDGPGYPFTQMLVGVRHYRMGGSRSQAFFWPLEQIDRKARPEAWR